jgi:hypothetical protein
MPYICTFCDYKTIDTGNYSRHKKSKKHLDKVNNKQRCRSHNLNHSISEEFGEDSTVVSTASKRNSDATKLICKTCGKTFSATYNLHRHINMKRCKVDSTVVVELQEKIKFHELEKELEKLRIELKCKEELNRDQKAFILSGKAGNTKQYNISIKNYVEQNFPNAPPLTIFQTQKLELLGREEDEYPLMEVLIFHNQQRKLPHYLGKFIISHHKKDDPSVQSIWTTDTSRLTYVIKELLDSKGSCWNSDKKGVKTKQFIVKPLLDHISQHIKQYIKESNEKAQRCINIDEQLTYFKKMELSAEIQTIIENGTLADDIIRFVAPHLYINKVPMLENKSSKKLI